MAHKATLALRKVMFMKSLPDLAAYRAAAGLQPGEDVDESKAAAYVRTLYPPPHLLVKNIKQWAREWHGARSETGERLFTIDTVKQVLLTLEAAVDWRLSGECRRVSHAFLHGYFLACWPCFINPCLC